MKKENICLIRYYKSLILFISLNLLFFFISFSKNPSDITIKFITTTDVHGAVFPIDQIKNKKTNYSLAQVYTYLAQERSKPEQEVIFLDNGDILQGQPLVYYYNHGTWDQTHKIAGIMNFMRYDAGTVGNHDIEAGHAVYDKLVKDFNFPWLSANIIDNKTQQPYFFPYTIIKRKGIKVAIIGLTTPYIPKWLPEKLWEGMVFKDMVSSAQYWVERIKKKIKPDIMVGLFHSGVGPKTHNKKKYTPGLENSSRQVAEQVAGFDIIFSGHDHQKYNAWCKNKYGESVRLLNAGKFAQVVAEATIKLSYNTDSHSWEKNIKGKLIKISNFPPDPFFIKCYEPDLEDLNFFLNQKLGILTHSISSRDALLGDSAFVDLLHQFQLEITKADISFAGPLSFDNTIEKGDIYIRDLFRLYRFENFLYTIEMSGEEIKNYLEYSYGRWFITMNNWNDHLLNFRTDQTGKIRRWGNRYELKYPYYNFDTAAGIIYEVDIRQPIGKRIHIISMPDGSPFDSSKKYKVAMNSYRGLGGGGHMLQGAKISKTQLKNRILNASEKDIRFLLQQWIKKKKTISPVVQENWDVIPQEWYEKAKKKDYSLLFGSEK